MILVFDVDDTLYCEENYVLSGFKAVSDYLSSTYGVSVTDTEMFEYMKQNGRGRVFDFILAECGLYSKILVKKCISIYHKHKPNISLPNKTVECLVRFKNLPKYVVTDGNKLVQKNKIDALGLKNYVKKSYITHQYGKKYSKPSIYCFDLIRQREKCDFCDIIYVGDNPNKDFINLKKNGCKTIRVNQGFFKDKKFPKQYEADYQIQSLDELTEEFLCKIVHTS